MKTRIIVTILILMLLVVSVNAGKPDSPPAHGIQGDLVIFDTEELHLEIQTFRLNPAGMKIPVIPADNLQTSIKQSSVHNRKITWWITRGQSFKGITNVLTSNVPISQQTNTRLVFVGTSHYFDYKDYLDMGFNVELTFNSDYEVQINVFKDSYSKDVIEFDPVFGSNINTKYYEFEVCHPDWECETYASCEINDSKYCITATDNNICGVVFDGNWSDVTDYVGVCDYCVQSWTANYSECVNTERVLSYVFDNACCNVTGLSGDCTPPGDNGTTTSCFSPTYEADDLDNIFIDFVGNYAVILVSLAGLIALGVIFTIVIVKLKRR